MKNDGLIQHFGSVRLRVTGSGTLELKLLSMDAVFTRTLGDITMSSESNKESLRPTNFTQQRAQLEIKTSEINEVFLISKIVVYTKPIASAFPG